MFPNLDASPYTSLELASQTLFSLLRYCKPNIVISHQITRYAVNNTTVFNPPTTITSSHQGEFVLTYA